MATNKTLNPTGVTIAIPAMADKPDSSVFSNCIDKEADAINTLNSNIKAAYTDAKIVSVLVSVPLTDGTGEVDISDYIPSGYRISIPVASLLSTGSLSVTGCSKKASSNTVIILRVGQTYTGTVDVNIITTIIRI